MFSWFRRKPKSPTPAGQPSQQLPGQEDAGGPAEPVEVVEGRMTFSDGERTWEEAFDCVSLLLETLRRQGRVVRAEDGRVLDESTGLVLRPVLVDVQPIHGRGVRTGTKIEVRHPTGIPVPVFEFQHSTGGTIAESLNAGFESWASCDLMALSDAIRVDPLDCTAMFVGG